MWDATKFHIELTNMCTAKCPFCMRTEQNTVYSDELFLIDIKKFFTKDICSKMKHLTLCGSFWDPIYAKDFLAIVEYFSKSKIKINIHTNWYNKKEGFWTKLWWFKNVTVTFGIDGVTQETHSLHRKWTNLKQILSNAREYNIAWWESIWQLILFKENIKQLKQAQFLSKQLWFNDFITYKSRAFNTDLHNPFMSNIKEIKNKKHESYSCEYSDRKELYINAQWQLLPCCWLSHIEKTDTDLMDSKMNIKSNSFSEIKEHDTWWKKIWQFYYKDVGNMCLRKCGVSTNSK